MKTRSCIIALMTAASVALSPVPAAFGDAASLKTTLEASGSQNITTLDVNLNPGLLGYYYGDVTMRSEINTVVAQIRDLRGRAWDENPTINFFSLKDYSRHIMRLQDAARFEGLNTRSAYQNAIDWDPALEHIALQRAVEANYKFEHVRPDGTDCWTVDQDKFSAENLAHNAMTEAIAGFEREWPNLRSRTGEFGHLQNMLDPANRAFSQAQAGESTAQLLARKDSPAQPAPINDGRHAIPVTFPESALAQARLSSRGGTSVGDTGQFQAVLNDNSGVIALPGSYGTSNPTVLNVESNGSYEALAPGKAQVRFAGLTLNNEKLGTPAQSLAKDVLVKKVSAPVQNPSTDGQSSSTGSQVGMIVGIIAAILALFGVGAQVLRQVGIIG